MVKEIVLQLTPNAFYRQEKFVKRAIVNYEDGRTQIIPFEGNKDFPKIEKIFDAPDVVTVSFDNSECVVKKDGKYERVPFNDKKISSVKKAIQNILTKL